MKNIFLITSPSAADEPRTALLLSSGVAAVVAIVAAILGHFESAYRLLLDIRVLAIDANKVVRYTATHALTQMASGLFAFVSAILLVVYSRPGRNRDEDIRVSSALYGACATGLLYIACSAWTIVSRPIPGNKHSRLLNNEMGAEENNI